MEEKGKERRERRAPGEREEWKEGEEKKVGSKEIKDKLREC